jgi:GH15 family glucan-1,4-alpha-glucosidase
VSEADYPPLEDYGLIGDCHSAALVSRHGSIDWCCLPRFDSESCFARILDHERGGCCYLRAADPEARCERRYLPHTLILETTWRTATGEARVLDFFPHGQDTGRRLDHEIVRIVEGVSGQVEMEIEVAPRFDFGRLHPWIRQHDHGVHTVIGGDNGLAVYSDLELMLLDDEDLHGRVTVHAGERRRLCLVYAPPERLYPTAPAPFDLDLADRRLQATERWWRQWSQKIGAPDPFRDAVLRSAIIVKAMTYEPTGAVVAAVTTSLPESIGGERNWDYRYTWIRDSALALRSLGEVGCDAEAMSFRYFIERTTAGRAEQIQVMYGVAGQHYLREFEIEELDGYRGSRPVRVGNGAWNQLQLDIYGDLLDLALQSHRKGSSPEPDYWRFLCGTIDLVERRWQQKDRGIWEVRGEPEHFVHSKVSCWVAYDRAIRLAEDAGFDDAPLDHWREQRDRIRSSIEEHGVRDGAFVRAYGADQVDAALLLLPILGFVAFDDPRMQKTIDRVQEELGAGDGLICRYRADDALEGDEGVFVACSFWLAQCLAEQGRATRARQVYDRACATANDLGLFSEEYDRIGHHMLGNLPQGLSHYAHITASLALCRVEQGAVDPDRGDPP